ncbi:MAG: hypothetical protein EXX96DRAFT_492598, partial [Benjaminiella poitrasii]
PYQLETLTHLRLYCEKQGSEQKKSIDEGLDVEMEEIALKPWHLSGIYKVHQNYSPRNLFFYHDYTGTFNTVSVQFLYKDEKGAVVDELGRLEPMDYIVDKEQYRLEALSPSTQYLSKLFPS